MPPTERLLEEASSFAVAEKRPYHTPELTDLGALPDVTHTSSVYTTAYDTGTGGANIYAS
jgi:hypothetical protein